MGLARKLDVLQRYVYLGRSSTVSHSLFPFSTITIHPGSSHKRTQRASLVLLHFHAVSVRLYPLFHFSFSLGLLSPCSSNTTHLTGWRTALFLRLDGCSVPPLGFRCFIFQCTWGKETAKKARTQQHFESLENYIRALEAKVKDLQADLEHCRQNHGGPSPAPSSDAGLHASTSLLPRRESSEPEIPTDDEGHTTTTSDSDIEHLISPTRHLLVRAFPSSVISVFFFAPSDASFLFSRWASPTSSPLPRIPFLFLLPISPQRCALVVMLWRLRFRE